MICQLLYSLFNLYRKAVANECEIEANLFYNRLHRCFFLLDPLFSLFTLGLFGDLINRLN